jgi:hypothetical protein
MRAAVPVPDDPYLRIMLGCAYEQKAHGLQWAESIGVANTSVAFVMLVGAGLATRFEAECFSSKSTDSLCL